MSVSSECLVNVIEEVVSQSGISECFIGVILLPIVGNACEHAAAVRFAIYNKPGLSISIAVGSSVQVARWSRCLRCHMISRIAGAHA